MQKDTTLADVLAPELLDTHGQFIVKLPNSQNLLLCTCTALTWKVRIVDKNLQISEPIKENIDDDTLTQFIKNILKVDKINEKSVKKALKK